MENLSKVDQMDRFYNEIWRVKNYFAEEYGLTYNEMIGTLELIKYDLLKESDANC